MDNFVTSVQYSIRKNKAYSINCVKSVINKYSIKRTKKFCFHRNKRRWNKRDINKCFFFLTEKELLTN